MSESVAFITIELSRKQVDTSNLVHNDKTNKDYARVFAGCFRFGICNCNVCNLVQKVAAEGNVEGSHQQGQIQG